VGGVGTGGICGRWTQAGIVEGILYASGASSTFLFDFHYGNIICILFIIQVDLCSSFADNKLSVTTSTLDSSTLIFDASRWRKVDWWKNSFYLVFVENVNDWPFG
jgi:hypothetical protein